MKLHIQIVNYKTKQYLLKLLESLSADLKDFSYKYLISILDNNSEEDLSDIKSRSPELNIQTLQGKNNVGFGAGHNILSKTAESEYLFLLNPDVEIIEPNTINRLIKTLEKNNAAVIGPRLVSSKRKTQHWDHGELFGLFAKIALFFGHSFWKESVTIEEVAWISGAVFLIKKSIFDKAGGFDEKFFLYKEEEDLCLRIRKSGGKIIYDPTISVMHIGGVIAKKNEHIGKSTKYFKKKHNKY